MHLHVSPVVRLSIDTSNGARGVRCMIRARTLRHASVMFSPGTEIAQWGLGGGWMVGVDAGNLQQGYCGTVSAFGEFGRVRACHYRFSVAQKAYISNFLTTLSRV